jgi:hypothetical protein
MTELTKEYVKDICRGYHERRREIEIGGKGRPMRERMLREYRRLNSAVDGALLLVEDPPLREQIKKALVEQRGFNSMYEHYCGFNQFYRYKRRVMQEIARQLFLVEE